VSSPLLDISIDGAKGILFTVTGGADLTMDEVNEAAQVITESADQNAKIIVGMVIDENMKDKIRVTVVATGFGGSEAGAKNLSDDTKYSMNRLFSKKNIEEKLNDVKNVFTEKPVFMPAASSQSDNQPTEPERPRPTFVPTQPAPKPRTFIPQEEEDLEIPAFIRKKMK